MSPVLVSGDMVVVNSVDGPIERGELVAIKFRSRSIPIVKRVIAVSGDRVEIKDNGIYVNSERHRDIDSSRWKSTANQLKHYDWTVPRKHFFVLGDNPENSLDSRRLGIIAYDQIQGKVIKIIKKTSH